MSTRNRKKGGSAEASGHRGVPGRRHYEYAPPESNEQGKTDAARSASIDAHGQAHAQRPPDSGKARSVKE
jgi:hypothetical protein